MRPRRDLHPRITVLQTAALLLGYVVKKNLVFLVIKLTMISLGKQKLGESNIIRTLSWRQLDP